MKRHLIVSSIAIIFMLASCKKDDTTDTNTAEIQGTYMLKYLTSKTNSTVTATNGEKTVTTSDYTTINNQGTIVFDASTLTAAGLTYKVDTEAKGYIYFGADLIDSLSFPFTFTLPVSNSAGQYQLMGADSIYFPQGGITSDVGGTGSFQAGPSGGRYSWSGSQLTITQFYSKDSSYQDSGETVTIKNSAVSSIVMEKQ